MTTRRRFLCITAAALVGSALPAAAKARIHVWHGTALGARATIRAHHPEATRICAEAAAEIARLEDIFSLYRPQSALMRLNAQGYLDLPPFELLECLSLAGRIHSATAGLFDPTVQPLWALHAERAAAGTVARADEVAAVLPLIGWAGVSLDSRAIRLRPGMALTLNGIAQGYIADRIADLMRAEGLDDVLIDTGELLALGPSDWPVGLPDGDRLALAREALATSAPLGTVLDQAGLVGHILDPRTGFPVAAHWRSVTVSDPSAARADALSTALCLTKALDEAGRILVSFPKARLRAAIPA